MTYFFSIPEHEFTHVEEKSAVISKIFPVILYPVYLYIPWSKSMMFKFLIKTLVTLIACSVKPRVHHHKGHIFPRNCISTITITTYMMLTLSWPAHDWRKKNWAVSVQTDVLKKSPMCDATDNTPITLSREKPSPGLALLFSACKFCEL